MKKVLFLTMILALTASVASAGLMGVWIPDTTGAGNSRYTLQVTSDVGIMTGFDMVIYDPSGSMLQSSGVFSPTVNEDTHFLFQKSHVAPPLVTDLTITGDYEDESTLQAAFSATAGGIYDGGFTNPVNVLQVVTANPINPLSLQVYKTDWVGAPVGKVGSGGSAFLEEVVISDIPEPSTVVLLLALGLAGLVAWRRR